MSKGDFIELQREIDNICRVSPWTIDLLKNAVVTISQAPEGAQSDTLDGQGYVIGFVAGLGAIQQDVALKFIVRAAMSLDWNDPPEGAIQLLLKGFNCGLCQGWKFNPRTQPKVK